MHDLLAVAASCRSDLEALGINCGVVRGIELDKRACRTWGTCRKYPDGSYRIGISPKLLAEDVPLDVLKNTLYHEFLHAATGCSGHTGQWKQYAKLVSNALNVQISRTASWEDKGLDLKEDTTVRYRFACQGCGAEVIRFRACRFTKYYKRYRCARCGGSFRPQ